MIIFTKPKVEEYIPEPGLSGAYKAIEFAGRICTGTTPKSDSDGKEFTQRMIDSVPMHGRPLEFGSIYLLINDVNIVDRYKNNPYSRVNVFENDTNFYITTTMRVIAENNWYSDLDYSVSQEDHPGKFILRKYLLWDISRGIADEFRTHCSISTLMQSTRYCNYTRPRFGSCLKITTPTWLINQWQTEFATEFPEEALADYIKTSGTININIKEYLDSLINSEIHYNQLIANGMKPEYARGVLPLDTRTILFQCGYENDWEHFFFLRIGNGAHPDSTYIAAKANDILKLRKDIL